jgi:hypothetical protein
MPSCKSIVLVAFVICFVLNWINVYLLFELSVNKIIIRSLSNIYLFSRVCLNV